MIEPFSGSSQLFCIPNMYGFQNILVVLALLAPSFTLLASDAKVLNFSSFGNNDPNSNYYSVNSQDLTNDGKCVTWTNVCGLGIKDSFNSPCSSNGFTSLISENRLIYGNPKENTFALYSDTPNTLMVIKDEECTKKIYTVSGLDVTSTSSTLTEAECAEIKQKVEDEIEKNRLYWEEWNKNFQAYMNSLFGNYQGTNSYMTMKGLDQSGLSDNDESFIGSANSANNEYSSDDSTNYQLDSENLDEQEEEISEDSEDADEEEEEEQDEDDNQMTGQDSSNDQNDLAEKFGKRNITTDPFPQE